MQYVKQNILIVLLAGCALFSCNNRKKENEKPATAKYVHIDSFYIDSSEIGGDLKLYPDTTNQSLYRFMSDAIACRNLDTSYGLIKDPSEDFSIDYHDKKFLESLLIKKQPPVKTATADAMPIVIEYEPYEKCLKRTDINAMLKQKEMNKHIRWDNNRLGFDPGNHKNFYSFSVPVFSADSTKVIMKISVLCPGLCGTSETVLFKKENGKWTSQSGPTAYH